MDPLHATLTDNLSDPNQTSKMLVVIQIQTVRHTDGIGWYVKSRLASVLKKLIHQKKEKYLLFPVGGITLLSFVKNSKRHTCGMVFLNRTIIILHCLHFDFKVANIYKFKHLFGKLICGVAVSLFIANDIITSNVRHKL